MPIIQEPPITEDFKTRGNSVYGCSKAVAEKYIEEVNPHIILRYAHLYGKEKRYHGLIGNFIGRINKGLKPELYGGSQSNDFCYIKDIAQANLLALTAPWDKWNQVYNIGSGEEITAEEATATLAEVTGYVGQFDVTRKRSVDPERFVYDISKAKTMLKYQPKYTFERGLKDMNIEEELCLVS
jgi:UDP-N-acetylglucosamine 4-epimerase